MKNRFIAIYASIVTVLSSGSVTLAKTTVKGETDLPKQSISDMNTDVDNAKDTNIVIDTNEAELKNQCFNQLNEINDRLNATTRIVDTSYAKLEMLVDEGLLDEQVEAARDINHTIHWQLVARYRRSFATLMCQVKDLRYMAEMEKMNSVVLGHAIESKYGELKLRAHELTMNMGTDNTEAYHQLLQDINVFKAQVESEIARYYTSGYFDKAQQIEGKINQVTDTLEYIDGHYKPVGTLKMFKYYLLHPEKRPSSNRSSHDRSSSSSSSHSYSGGSSSGGSTGGGNNSTGGAGGESSSSGGNNSSGGAGGESNGSNNSTGSAGGETLSIYPGLGQNQSDISLKISIFGVNVAFLYGILNASLKRNFSGKTSAKAKTLGSKTRM